MGPLLALALVAAPVAGCGDDRDDYCAAVEEHQEELGELLGSGGPDALLRALPVFRDLAEETPDDLRDEWATVVDALGGLEEALDAAGVDPATYDRDQPPTGLGEAERDRIDAAARELASDRTVAALNGVDQQAKDVCGTPLQL